MKVLPKEDAVVNVSAPLYVTGHGMFAGPRILWDSEEGENDPQNKESEGDAGDKKEKEGSDDSSKDGKQDSKKTDEGSDDDETDEELSEKDSDLLKHLKHKVNRTNRQNKALRADKNALSKEVTTLRAEKDRLQREVTTLTSSQKQEKLESTLVRAGIADDPKILSKALKLLDESYYEEVQKEDASGKKIKVRELNVTKFKEENPFLFNGASSGGNKKKWIPQGGSGSGKSEQKSAAAPITSRFKGPSKRTSDN